MYIYSFFLVHCTSVGGTVPRGRLVRVWVYALCICPSLSCVVLYLGSWCCAGQSWSSLWGMRTCGSMYPPVLLLCRCTCSLVLILFKCDCVTSYAARAHQVGLALTGFFLCFLLLFCVVIKNLTLLEPYPFLIL